MTEAMPFLQKTILLSYDPRPFAAGADIFEKIMEISDCRKSLHRGRIVRPMPCGE